jgi:hypothetical protein
MRRIRSLTSVTWTGAVQSEFDDHFEAGSAMLTVRQEWRKAEDLKNEKRSNTASLDSELGRG